MCAHLKTKNKKHNATSSAICKFQTYCAWRYSLLLSSILSLRIATSADSRLSRWLNSFWTRDKVCASAWVLWYLTQMKNENTHWALQLSHCTCVELIIIITIIITGTAVSGVLAKQKANEICCLQEWISKAL